ncbi:hypothetical protein VTH06DRAFT_8584 [Thermothelomyces fergusii]
MSCFPVQTMPHNLVPVRVPILPVKPALSSMHVRSVYQRKTKQRHRKTNPYPPIPGHKNTHRWRLRAL